MGNSHEEIEYILDVENLDSSSVQVVRAFSSGTKIPNFIWMFKLFNLEVDKIKIEQLRKVVGKLTVQKLYDFTTRNDQKNALKKQYNLIAKTLSNDLNNTSIVIYHAPAKGYTRCGTLITGDINLKHGTANKLVNYYKNEINKVSLFSIPHHGSEHNWDIKLIDNGFLDGSICFASTHNYYSNRMTAIMMSDLRSHNISVLVVDENRFSEFWQFIRVFDDFLDYYIINKSQCFLQPLNT